MQIQPPGEIPAYGASSPQDMNPATVYDAIEKLESSHVDPALKETASQLLSQLNKKMTPQEMESTINTFLGQSYLNNDVWMLNGLSIGDSVALVSAINQGWTCTTPPFTQMDIFNANLLAYANQFVPDPNHPPTPVPPQWNFAQMLIAQVVGLGSSDDNIATLYNNMVPILTANQTIYQDNIYTDPQYQGLKFSDFENALGCISCPLPPFASTFVPFAYQYYDQGFGTASGVAGDLMKAMVNNWSATSTFDPNAWMNGALGNSSGAFFTTYPEITWIDFLSFSSTIDYSFPSWTEQYMNAGYWNASPGANDAGTGHYIFTQMNEAWPSGANPMPALQTWAQTCINQMFNNMPDPHFDEIGAAHLEMFFGLAAPALQDELFQCKTWASSWTGPDLAMINKIILKNLTPNWPNGTTTSFANSITSPPQFLDLYILYPNASSSAIQGIFQLIGSAATETPVDTLFRGSLTMSGNYPAGSNDAKLFLYLNGLCSQTGSANPPTAIDNWITSEIEKNPPFPDFQPLQPNTPIQILSLFTFEYTATYCRFQLMSLAEQQGASSPIGEFAQQLVQILNGYVETHPKPSLQDFQTYLNTNFAKEDFCFQWPGLGPADIGNIFTMMGVQSPHVYTTVDYAYEISLNGANQEPQPLPGPDASAFDVLYQQLIDAESHYDPANPNVDLLTLYAKPLIGQYMQLAGFQSLTLDTQQVFKTVYNLTPGTIAAISLAQNMQAQVDSGSLDYSNLGKVKTALWTTPGADVAVSILQIKNSPDWAFLGAATQQTLMNILNIISASNK